MNFLHRWIMLLLHAPKDTYLKGQTTLLIMHFVTTLLLYMSMIQQPDVFVSIRDKINKYNLFFSLKYYHRFNFQFKF